MDTAQWPQGIGVVKTVEKKPRPSKEQAVNCPRCNSTNTKFCYYNNYSLSQPRYFCKTCRRYWTEGGSLRNVPVGGGSRKNKRSSSSKNKITTIISSSDNLSPPNNFSSPPHQNPKIHEGQDLNLAYNPSHHYNIGLSEFGALPFGLENKDNNLSPQNPNFMEFFKTGNINIGTNPSVYNSSGFPAVLHDFKPSLGFSIDGLENGYENLQRVEDHHADNNNSSRNFIFPFGELKQVSNSDQQLDEQERGQGEGETNGFWNGMLAGGSSW